ncbi:MAG: glycosyltransferase family 4 protein [Bryobacterales bacterium]|nr:glycosyltransferase family 4 protein [Bryobacterales bacterium]
MHWSEVSHPGWKRIVGALPKKVYANLINRYSLGAFGVGQRAMTEFQEWGVKRELIGYLPYVAQAPSLGIGTLATRIRAFRGSSRTFASVGSLCRRKGSDILLAAVREVVRLGCDVKVVLSGPSVEPILDSETARFLLRKGRLLALGSVPCAEIGEVYSSCDVFVLPSRREGWGVVVNEACGSGLPIIVSNSVGAADHLVRHGHNGRVFESGSLTALIESLLDYCGPIPKSEREESLRMFEAARPEVIASQFHAAICERSERHHRGSVWRA